MTLSNFVLEAGFSSNISSTDYANKVLLILENGETLTYNDINIKSAQFAEYLINICKVKKGDCVICRTSKLNSVHLYLAVLRIGAIYVPINPDYTIVETEHFLTTVEPQAFITCNKLIDIKLKHLVKNENIIDEIEFVNEANKLNGIFDVKKVDNNDIAVILFTSGTTGKSKGAATSHGVLCENARLLVNSWKFDCNDVLLHALPFYHVHGMLIAFHCTIFSKSSTIFLNKYIVTDVINWMPKATVFMGVPTFYSRLLNSNNFKKETTLNVRLFVCGSAPLTEKLFNNFKKLTGKAILQRYGMTEANAITSSPYTEEERSYSNVGKPFTGVEIKISNKNLIFVRSKNIFSGYWKEPEKTKNEFDNDGFFNTGDVGELNDEGFLILKDREKDMIITGGLNVYSREIEDLINQNDGVKESAVFGLPHSDFGEAVVAACVLNVTNADKSKIINQLIDLCHEKLAPYKRPKKFLINDELPRNFLGKIQKNVLRERFNTLFN